MIDVSPLSHIVVVTNSIRFHPAYKLYVVRGLEFERFDHLLTPSQYFRTLEIAHGVQLTDRIREVYGGYRNGSLLDDYGTMDHRKSSVSPEAFVDAVHHALYRDHEDSLSRWEVDYLGACCRN